MRHLGAVAALLLAQPASAAPDAARMATAFGARPYAASPELSPDGSKLVFVSRGEGRVTAALVEDLTDGTISTALASNGSPLRVTGCGWSAADRLVCTLYAVTTIGKNNVGWDRIVATNPDSGHQLELSGLGRSMLALKIIGGDVADWSDGKDGTVLMSRWLRDGSYGVERVDTYTGRGLPLTPKLGGTRSASYIGDGSGGIRISAEWQFKENKVGGVTVYRYRLAGATDWRPFSKVDREGAEVRPLIVDGARNAAYGLKKLGGRDALYRVALDESLKTDLVYADPTVDVGGVLTIGRHNRVIGYFYTTDRVHAVYFDPDYAQLAASLGRALPKLPHIVFESATANERRLLFLAESDTDPGRYFLLNRDNHHLTEVLAVRPELETLTLAEQRSITYKAADGTLLPAYLTLPPAGAAKNIPAIVMPHGGPSARDIWGFDWFAQYFAQMGFAVLQPEFRGSTGYGTAFLNGNALRSWRTATQDVADAGRWLVAEGIADPAKLAIVGWSYGGYQALQANYVDPTLFKAAIAVAPQVDLRELNDSGGWFDPSPSALRKYYGTEDSLREGSPVRHATSFLAPVLMFHGDRDLNVDPKQSQMMADALKRAGKVARLVVYPGLDHQLEDSTVRADMLLQSYRFLADTLKLDGGR